jgi:hypothetical protein
VPLDKQHHQLRSALLELPGVKLGNRFRGEAFFVGKRFFCHFHRGGSLLLETFVWDKVDEVVHAIPGVIPHPQYGNYGWVRLRVSSSADLAKAKELVESSYRYMISIKRISLPKTERVRRGVNEAAKRFPKINFKMKQSRKRTQVVMEVRLLEDRAEAGTQLTQAARFLKKF